MEEKENNDEEEEEANTPPLTIEICQKCGKMKPYGREVRPDEESVSMCICPRDEEDQLSMEDRRHLIWQTN